MLSFINDGTRLAMNLRSQNTQIVPRSGMKLMMHQFFIATDTITVWVTPHLFNFQLIKNSLGNETSASYACSQSDTHNCIGSYVKQLLQNRPDRGRYPFLALAEGRQKIPQIAGAIVATSSALSLLKSI